MDDAVNLGIEGLFLLLIVLYLLLHGGDVLVEEGDLCLCAFLHALQGFLLLFDSLQVKFFLSLGCKQFVLFCLHFQLLLFEEFALCLLEGGVFLHVAHAPHHLGEVFGREDEHELVLHGTVLAHIDHCLGIAFLLGVEFLLQLDKLGVERVDGGGE